MGNPAEEILRDGRSYVLEFWIDRSTIPESHIWKRVQIGLGKLAGELTSWEVRPHRPNIRVIRLTGLAREIDACADHFKLETEWFHLATDELGDLVRKSSFPLLADIEVSLRNFVSRAIVEITGDFDWWSNLVPKKIKESVAATERSSKARGVYESSIHFTYFDDLVSLITAEVQRWPEEHRITVAELQQLVVDADSFEGLKRQLEDKTEKVSLWDDVFSKYFPDREKWHVLGEKIREKVIPVRNKVMHHRHVRLYELHNLYEIRNEVLSTIDNAQRELDPAQREAALNGTSVVSVALSADFDYIRALLGHVSVSAGIRLAEQLDEELIERLRESGERPIISKIVGLSSVPPDNFKESDVERLLRSNSYLQIDEEE